MSCGKAIARVHSVHTMNADSAQSGRQLSDQLDRLQLYLSSFIRCTYPHTVTHTNRVRRRVTTLIETNALPLSQTTTKFRRISSEHKPLRTDSL